MRKVFYNLALIYFVGLVACQEKIGVNITGCITNSMTKQPISRAEVLVLCWYMNGIDDASFDKKNRVYRC